MCRSEADVNLKLLPTAATTRERERSGKAKGNQAVNRAQGAITLEARIPSKEAPRGTKCVERLSV